MSSIDVYKRLLSMSGQYWQLFIGVVLCSSVFAGTDAGFAFMVKTLTEVVGAGADLTEEQALIKRWLPAGVLLLFLTRGIFGFLSSYGMSWIAQMVVKQLRGMVFEHYLDLPTAYYDQTSSGKLLSKLTYDVNQVAAAATTVVVSLIKDSLTIVVLIGYMTYLSPRLAIVVFVVAPVIALVIRLLSNKFREYARKIQQSVGEITRIGGETLQSHKIVKIFGGQEFESRRFDKVNDRQRRLAMRRAATGAIGNAVTVFATAFGVAGVIFFIGKIDIDVPRVAGFITAMVLLMAPMKRLTKINSTIQKAIAAGESLFGVLDEPAEMDTGDLSPESIEGRVEFRDVSFTYATTKGAVLDDINLSVEPGESIAIVGRSGSGKSTLVSLLPRFYDPERGQILVDGVPTTDFSLAGLRKHISIVSQEVMLFNDTIAANIAYGALAGVDDAQIKQAARAANVDEFTDGMPDGLKSVIGDRGVLLSGGQRQRISIARALLKNTPILVLDEATSSLDTHSERHIQAALDRLMENRTTFVIAHRLSTIEKVNRIIVMDQGRIIESGGHEELLAANGAYAALYRLQFREDHAEAPA